MKKLELEDTHKKRRPRKHSMNLDTYKTKYETVKRVMEDLPPVSMSTPKMSKTVFMNK